MNLTEEHLANRFKKEVEELIPDFSFFHTLLTKDEQQDCIFKTTLDLIISWRKGKINLDGNYRGLLVIYFKNNIYRIVNRNNGKKEVIRRNTYSIHDRYHRGDNPNGDEDLDETFYYPENMKQYQEITDEQAKADRKKILATFTPQERAIINWISKGWSIRLLADVLEIPESTLGRYLNNMYYQIDKQLGFTTKIKNYKKCLKTWQES